MLLPSRCISSTRCSLHGPQQRARAARPLQRLRPCADAAPAQQPEAQPAPAQLQGPAVLQTLCARALARAGFKERHLIGIAGAPGSGKSTLASEMVQELNALAGAQIAVLLPMDGFHLYRSELDKMPDPKEAHARRGAPWTFDAEAFVECVREVKETTDMAVLAPSFDHGVGDPKPGGVRVLPSHRIVLVEGNYVLLGQEPWCRLLDDAVLDDAWFVDVPLDVAMGRVLRRQTGNGLSPEASRVRIDHNDRPNGELVAGSRGRARLVVSSSEPYR